MADFRLGNGDDIFGYGTDPGVEDIAAGSRVFGGNGDDWMGTGSFVRYSPSFILFDGGNGDDTLAASFTSESTLIGGRGDDLVVSGDTTSLNLLQGGRGDDTVGALGPGHVLEGGPGEDVLMSGGPSFFPSMTLPGTLLSGGPGQDRFMLLGGEAGVVTARDCQGPDVVTEGDVILGRVDVITDYQRGELIELSGGPQRLVEEIGLEQPDGLGDRHLALAAGEHGLLRGEVVSPTEFQVTAGGEDLLVAFHTTQGSYGTVAVLGAAAEGVLIG